MNSFLVSRGVIEEPTSTENTAGDGIVKVHSNLCSFVFFSFEDGYSLDCVGTSRTFSHGTFVFLLFLFGVNHLATG